MFIVFLRVIIIYISVLIFLRLMGKRQIGEMQPYEVVITLIIADLATLPMSDTNIPLLNGILPLAILLLVHFGLTLLTRKSTKFRQFLSGKSMIVISPNGIDFKALRQLNMGIDDLMEMLRQANFYNFEQVLYAIIETNGKMSVIPTSSFSPVTAQDLNIQNPDAKLPHVIVFNGKINKKELSKLHLNQDNLNKILNLINVTNIKNLLIFSLDESGKAYFQLNNQSFKVIDNIFKEISLWKFGFQFQ